MQTKPLLAYAALVGLPLAGLAMVLHAGRGLQAPPAIAGEWQIEWPADAPKPPTAPAQAQSRFTVTQSGIHISLDVMGSEYRGELRGDSVIARSTREQASNDCRDAAHTVLRARIDTAATPQRMSFMLAAPRSSECPGPLTAVRIEAQKGGRR